MYSGKRSVESKLRREQKRAAKTYILQYSFNDVLIHEQVCRSDPEDVEEHLASTFGYVELSAVPATFKGVVLLNDYGHGVFQNDL